MKIAKIILAIAFAAICASAEGLYTVFNATIGAEFYTADTPNGDYEIFDQAGPPSVSVLMSDSRLPFKTEEIWQWALAGTVSSSPLNPETRMTPLFS